MEHYIFANALDRRTIEVLVSHGHLPTMFSQRKDPLQPVIHGPHSGPYDSSWKGTVQEWLDLHPRDRGNMGGDSDAEESESESCEVIPSPGESHHSSQRGYPAAAARPMQMAGAAGAAGPAMPGGNFGQQKFLYRFGTKRTIHKGSCHHLARPECRPPSKLMWCSWCEESSYLEEVIPDRHGMWHNPEHPRLKNFNRD